MMKNKSELLSKATSVNMYFCKQGEADKSNIHCLSAPKSCNRSLKKRIKLYHLTNLVKREIHQIKYIENWTRREHLNR